MKFRGRRRRKEGKGDDDDDKQNKDRAKRGCAEKIAILKETAQ